MSKRYETIGKYKIFFDELYYIGYAGGKRELTKKDQDNWNGLLVLPYEIQLREKKRLGLNKNPNVIPIKGINLLEFIKDLKFTPFFDSFFEKTHLLKLTDLVIYESIKAKNYELAMKGK